MSLIDLVKTCLQAPDLGSAQEAKAEIREELEFHLSMTAQENERIGMSASEARADALRRFGDVAEIESACQKVQLGPQRLLQGIHVGLVFAFVALIAFVAVTSYRSQARHHVALEGLQQSVRHLQENLSVMADRAPPVVVETFPDSGATNVDPRAGEIRVTFSKEMMDQSWSWCRTGNPFPKSVGPIHYAEDGKTCIMPVELEPGTDYVLQINSPRYDNFKDATGRPAEPYLLCFSTAVIQ